MVTIFGFSLVSIANANNSNNTETGNEEVLKEDPEKQTQIKEEPSKLEEVAPASKETKVGADTSINTISRYNFLFYFIYKYKYENRMAGFEELQSLTTN